MEITWAYIAGFFDGEGTIYLEKKKRLWRLSICQSQEQVLKDIKAKAKFGNIHSRKKWKDNNHFGKKEMWIWYVNDQRQIVEIIEYILPHSIVKKEKLKEALEFLKKAGWHKNYKLQDLSRKELNRLYRTQSIRKVCKHLGVTYNAVYTALQKHKIPIRTMSEATKLRPKRYKMDAVSDKELEKKYNEIGIKESAKYFNVSETTIWMTLKNRGIKKK